jgi:hypothetical protein
MNCGRSRVTALNQARANARFFGRPYYVFTDTSGNLHVERDRPGSVPCVEVRPDGTSITIEEDA